MRLKDKIAIVVGAGQTAGDTMGNGRATALLFAREGAKVVLVDRDVDSARETLSLVEAEGGAGVALEGDVTNEDDCRRYAEACVETYGRIDILHNNVGVGRGDHGPVHLEEAAWDRIMDINLKGMFFSCKHVLPIMRKQKKGAIVNISSAAAVAAVGMLAYKTSKAGVNALTHSIAMGNAKYGIRANVIMPGLIKTPMAIEGISEARGIPKEDLIRERDARVPLLGGMGEAQDVANAALFLASDEAKFVTGVVLPVDGGQCALIG